MAIIALHEVTKIYRLGGQEIRALDGVSLDIAEGEYLSIIGPSGSGKSTMMQLIGCLDTPTSGRIDLDGREISNASGDELSRIRCGKIGFVFQSFNLLPRLDVAGNVEVPLIYAGLRARERRARVAEAIEAVGLQDRARNRPSQLSGGQAQRVAIARALVNRPRILLADEPTGALDTATGEAILELFRDLNRKGHTVALVTHDPDIARETPRRVELRDGRLVSGRDSHYSAWMGAGGGR